MSPEPIHLVYAAVLGALGGAFGAVAAVMYLHAEDLFRRAVWEDGVSRWDKARTTVGWIHFKMDWRHLLTWAVPRAAALGAAFGVTALVCATGLWVIFL